MRTIKLLTLIMAALALLLLPVAAQARDRGQHSRHGARSHAPHSAGVVRSFRNGVLTIRLAGGGTKTGDVTDSTKLTCQANRSKRSRQRARAQRRLKRARRALAAAETSPGDDPGAGDDIGNDTGDDIGDDTTGDDPVDDTGDDTTDDTADDTGDGADNPDPAPARHRAKGACSTAKLRRGMRVKAAKLGSSPDGPVWTRIALQRRKP